MQRDVDLLERITNKGELLDLVADSALAELPRDRPGGRVVRRHRPKLMTALHSLLVRYPAVAHIMVQRRLSGPIALERGGAAIKRLPRAGFDDATSVELFIAAASSTQSGSRSTRSPVKIPKFWVPSEDSTRSPNMIGRSFTALAGESPR